ncbi:hypothetical protein ACQKIE_03195 [Luteibacter sp. NPDC031894]|uniref:hypothetical protein n=1 Tax=Luteibacter sp. NPDC031894 TaxID=3390572 RepID=UPI003CFF1251
MIGSVSTVTGGVYAPAVRAAAVTVPVSVADGPPSVVVTLGAEQDVAPTYSLGGLVPPAGRASASDALTTATLTVRTASGKSVVLDVTGDEGSQDIGIRSDATLDEGELAAVGKLARAFQAALTGIVSNPPHIDLDGLARFDAATFSAVDLAVQTVDLGQAPVRFAFHADAASRTLTLSNGSGVIDIGVDMGSPAILGSTGQRAEALAGYLRQFDTATSRGQGDRAFMDMFKDAFTQLTAVPDTSAQGVLPTAGALSRGAHAMLTGLPDFHASMTQASSASNPYKPAENDGFSYDVSQETKISGNGPLDWGVSQHLHAQLSAAYHSPLTPDASLMLTLDPKSQNYYYTRIDDVADSQTDIAYEKGRLMKASMTRSASETTDRSKYVMGKLVEQTATPYSKSATRDLLGLLRSVEDDGSPPTRQRQAERDRVYAGVHAGIGLESDPGRIA